MTRRSVRITLVCFGVLITAALSYRIVVDEQHLTFERTQLASVDGSISDVLRTLADVRAALHAYVAPGQRSSVWETRSAALFDKLRQQLISLDTAADSSGHSVSDALDNLDQLTAAEKRVQHYLDFSQPLLAGDVIFTEIRDLVEATGQQVITVREQLRLQATSRIDRARQEQMILLSAGAVVWLGLALLLALFPEHRPALMSLPTLGSQPPQADQFDLSLTARPSTASVPEPPPATVEEEPAAQVETQEVSRWRNLANVCKELSAAKEMALLPAPLSRACEALAAKNAIVWVAAADGTTLAAQASHGFDSRLLARIGTIARDSANLTAAAFRDGQPHKSRATGSTLAALAVPLRGPSGPVGVLSAELEPHSDITEAVDLATMFAAQIAPLVLHGQGATGESPQRRQA